MGHVAAELACAADHDRDIIVQFKKSIHSGGTLLATRRREQHAKQGSFASRTTQGLWRAGSFFDSAFRQISTWRTSPETKYRERSSDAVQAYARVRAVHVKRRGQPSPEFSLNARIPTLPNCVQEGEFKLASTALVKLHDLLWRSGADSCSPQACFRQSTRWTSTLR
ncbi:hypothetical protein CEE69_26075 [Rhodopirellula bahusiensis]|uniref:Uncharacterized protein n=1 Tax=Rhodopirellula bahusiensis TaxID=2014065 RepID=A0A2G1W075_9BACT|nr:hypothetical protein CEE69_26075 [Rhodopirellula bahusiensis]